MSSNGAAFEDRDDDEKGGNVREQDRFLPIANISRIMKKALPANAKIAKDAKETVQECVSEFISFITSECDPKAPLPGLGTQALCLSPEHLTLPIYLCVPLSSPLPLQSKR